MSDLSWIIILADILGNIKLTVGLLITFYFVGYIVWYIVMAMHFDTERQYENLKNHKFSRKLIPTVIILWFVLAFIPSSTTFYSVGAVETLNRVYLSPEMTELSRNTIQLLNDKIQENLNDKK